jgi:hypothetical protein
VDVAEITMSASRMRCFIPCTMPESELSSGADACSAWRSSHVADRYEATGVHFNGVVARLTAGALIENRQSPHEADGPVSSPLLGELPRGQLFPHDLRDALVEARELRGSRPIDGGVEAGDRDSGSSATTDGDGAERTRGRCPGRVPLPTVGVPGLRERSTLARPKIPGPTAADTPVRAHGACDRERGAKLAGAAARQSSGGRPRAETSTCLLARRRVRLVAGGTRGALRSWEPTGAVTVWLVTVGTLSDPDSQVAPQTSYTWRAPM